MPGPEYITLDEYRRLVASGRIGPRKGRKRLKLPPRAQIEAPVGKISALPLSITFPWPPTENHLWVHARDKQTGQVRRYLTDKARNYRKSIAHLLLGLRLDPALLYRPTWHFVYAWHFKNGKIRRIDEPNYIKFIQDCVCDAAEIDDCRFKAASHFSTDIAQDVEWSITLTIEALTAGADVTPK